MTVAQAMKGRLRDEKRYNDTLCSLFGKQLGIFLDNEAIPHYEFIQDNVLNVYKTFDYYRNVQEIFSYKN